jgi:hypothetical protein
LRQHHVADPGRADDEKALCRIRQALITKYRAGCARPSHPC